MDEYGLSARVDLDVDVVVVSYNSRAHLRRCIEPIARGLMDRIVVVDNASADDATATISDLPVTVVAEESNRGFAHGCNRGWRLGSAPYVLFLNPDCEIHAAAIAALVAVLEGNEKAGIVGPRILDHSGSVARSQFRFPRVLSTFSEALYLHRLWRTSPWASETVFELASYERPHEAEWLSGACLLVRRELLECVGGFDETFFMYSEDAELCRAARSCGYSVHFEPTASVVHIGGGSAPRAALLTMRMRSRVLYVSKNYPLRISVVHRLGFALESLSHAIVGKGGWPGRRGYLASFNTALFGPSGRRDGSTPNIREG